MSNIIFKQGESKTINITVKDSLNVAVNLSGATLTLGVKASKNDTSYAITKDDTAFNKDLAASGIVSVPLTATDTNIAEGDYIGELKCSWASGATINKSTDFLLQIKKAITS
jgi:hypothetical protein